MFGEREAAGARPQVKRETAFIWYDRTATDERVWCVRRGDSTVRCVGVAFENGVTSFAAEGHSDLQPGGPRGAIRAEGVTCFDEVAL